jgi:putative peptide zinc metalloprotease protein
MNILEALEVALPELPAKVVQRTYPKLDSRVIAREHQEQGMPVILAKMPGSDSFVRLTPDQWKLLQLFDGERSYEQIAVDLAETMAVPFSSDDVKEFSSFLQEQTDLFYRTPLEKNVTLRAKMGEERHKRKHIADITDIVLHRWPHADDYLTRLQPYVEFIYTPWFTIMTLFFFVLMAWMWTDKFSEIWRDSFEFYNFTSKSFSDLLEFWLLFGVMAFFHESAHGMTCKHFGANVEKMEFLLMYFAPTFVCDVTQIWIVGDRKARLATIIAGIWIDLVICSAATILWWSTPSGMGIHDFAYKVIMVSGIGVTVVNLNPLIKLDGYYMFSEITGEVDLKERATAYISGWVRKSIFRLPVEIEYVPRRRRIFYIAYAFLSGVYSYSLITFVIIFAYHVLRSYSPVWAWVPTLFIAYLLFKSRIHTLGRFMKLVYLDKRERMRAWFTPLRASAIAVVVLVVLFASFWPDSVEGRFVLEPVRRAVIRAQEPGVVAEIPVVEGQRVSEGSPLVTLRNLQLETYAAKADADRSVAAAHTIGASLHYVGLGAAERELQQAEQRSRTAQAELAHLRMVSPISGVVVTPRAADLVGRYVSAGTDLVEIDDQSFLWARIYLPEFELRNIQIGARVRLEPQAAALPLSGTLTSLSTVPTNIDPALAEKSQLVGIVLPQFYVGSVLLPNDGSLRPGMTGDAKVFIGRRSPAALAWRFVRDLIDRRVW